MTNSEISDLLSLYSKLLDIHRENEDKAKSFATASFQIDRLPTELSDMPPEKISKVRGIGKTIAPSVIQLLQQGTLDDLNRLMLQTPEGILELMKIKGVGPKKLATIWHDLQVTSPGELLYACNENRLVHYKGFGAKTQQQILEALEFYFSNQSKFLYAQVESLAEQINTAFEQLFPDMLFSLTGAVARQEDIIEVLEWVVAGPVEEVIERISSIPGFVFDREEEDTIYFHYDESMPVEITCTDQESFYGTVCYTRSAAEFNEAFQEAYPEIDFSLEVQSEEEFFEQANLEYIPPYLRSTPDSISWSAQHQLPEPIASSDIHGVIHNHSTWSDGAEKIETMAMECIRLGYQYLVMSDHSVTSFYANGLSVDRIYQQQEEIDRLNEKLFPFKIYKSIECDILSDGQLDYSDQVLATFDLVIASVHQNLQMTEEKAMQRLLAAVQHPFTTILGHPTGRLLLSRKGYPVDMEQLIAACASNEVVIEINANPRRLDLDWRFIQQTLGAGVRLSINPDAHSLKGIQDIHWGIISARKGGLTKQHNLSSLTRDEFELFLSERKKKRGL